MSNLRKQSDTTYPLVFFMADITDHTTGKAGLSPTVTLSKNGGAFGAAAGAVSEIASGWYKVSGNATDSNTLGPLILHATGPGADVTDAVFGVVSHDPFAIATATENAARVLDTETLDTGLTVRHGLELAAGSVLNKLSGAGTATEVRRNFSDTADLATLTVDASGNVTAATYDFSI